MNKVVEIVQDDVMATPDSFSGEFDYFVVGDGTEIHPAALIMPPMSDYEFEKFKEDISGNGLLEPVVMFQGKVLDGRNRYNACRDLGIEVWAREWEGGMDPVEYVVSKNIHRRQLTPAQRAVAATKATEFYSEQAKEAQRQAGRFEGKNEDGTPKVKEVQLPEQVPEAEDDDRHEREARSRAGKMFDVSGKSVSDAKYVMEHGTDEEKYALESGQAAIKPTAKIVREREAIKVKPKPAFNQTTDSIKWAKWTWNPVTGCKHGCPYCYARDITKRHPDGFPNGFEPHFYPERLEAPINTKLPARTNDGWRNVFVCSMADLFGEWVPQEWIDSVLNACDQDPEWTYLFLTKNPARLVDIQWPENAWVGTTVDCQERVAPAVESFNKLNKSGMRPPVLFLSCEPMVERLDFGDDGLDPFDWVIIGGRSASSGMPAAQPMWEWVFKLVGDAVAANCRVFCKNNVQVWPQQWPESVG